MASGVISAESRHPPGYKERVVLHAAALNIFDDFIFCNSKKLFRAEPPPVIQLL